VVFRPPLYLDDGECQEDVDDVAVTNVIDLTQNGPDRTLLIDLTSPASPQKQVGTLSPPRAAEMPTPAQGQAPGPNFDFNSPMTPGCHPSSSERGLAPQYGSDFELDPVPEPEQEQEPEHESELEPEQDQDLSIHLSDEGDDVDDCSSDEAEMWGYVSDGSMPDADHLESDLEDRSELGDTDEELPDDDDDGMSAPAFIGLRPADSQSLDDLLSGFHYSDDDLDDYDEDTDSIVDDEQLLEATAVTYPLGQVLPNGQVDFSQPKFVQPDALHGGLVEVLQKPNACNISSLLNPDPRPASHTTVTTDPTPTTAAVLGHKTGKHEFFAAREENKLHFTQREHPVGYKVAPPLSTQPQREASHQQEPSHQQGPSHQQEPSRQPVSIEKPAAEGIPGAGPVGRSDYVQELAKSPLLDSGERFLNSPLVADSAPSQEPLIPGLDDILSAADFHQKKLLALEVAAAQTATKFKAVTILVNDDEPACPAPVPSSQRSKVQVLQEISHQAVKRKAADISTGDDAPVPPATQATSSTNERRILPAVGKTRGTDGEPPAKRNATEAAKKNAEREAGRRITRKGKGKAWQLVEKAGLVALGGAVVLGSLIYSAPTF